MHLPNRRTIASAIPASRNRTATPVKLTTLLVAACFALGLPAAYAADALPTQSAKAQPAKSKSAAKKKAGKGKTAKLAAAAPVAGGMVVHIDPNTGEFSKEPIPGRPGLVLSPATRNSFSTSSDGLYEEPAAGGGFKVDLQGRFQSPLVATIGPDGKVRMGHPQIPTGEKK